MDWRLFGFLVLIGFLIFSSLSLIFYSGVVRYRIVSYLLHCWTPAIHTSAPDCWTIHKSIKTATHNSQLVDSPVHCSDNAGHLASVNVFTKHSRPQTARTKDHFILLLT